MRRCILGIDPGPTTCGVAMFDHANGRVAWSEQKMPLLEVLEYIAGCAVTGESPFVAVERVQSYGIAGASLLATSEVVGRIQQRALDSRLGVSLHYRREVLRVLDVTGKGGRDAMVRQRLLEVFADIHDCAPTAKALQGRKASPGPLYGVSGHAWQALGVGVCAWRMGVAGAA